MARRNRNAVVERLELMKKEKSDLLVFGYNCKLFRDDERAQSLHDGAHLIPWMGDESLMIDRYDGRGHIHDLTPYDSSISGAQSLHGDLSEEEKRIEALCNKERYLGLDVDLEERAIEEEEEIKRLNQELAVGGPGYSAMGFSYGTPAGRDETSHQHAAAAAAPRHVEAEEDEPYEPPVNLRVPPSMTTPSTIRLNNVIEKTASFVGQHGGQMEIMIKTKQSNNPQFLFLNFEHPLNSYYKHVIRMIKSGMYRPQAPKQKAMNEETPYSYLHPSLGQAASAAQPLGQTVPQYTASQLENTSYGQLLKRMAPSHKRQPMGGQSGGSDSLRGSPAPSVSPAGSPAPPPPPSDLPVPASAHTNNNNRHDKILKPTSAQSSHSQRGHVSSAIQSLSAYGPSMDDQDDDDDDDEDNEDSINGTVVIPAAYAGPSLHNSSRGESRARSSVRPGCSTAPSPPLQSKAESEPELEPAPHNAQYDMVYVNGAWVLSPPPEILEFMTRMAPYVERGGEDFEDRMRLKQDQRFAFLDPAHALNHYWKLVKAGEVDDPQSLPSTATPVSKAESQPQDDGREEDQQVQTAAGKLCFSIKQRDKESSPLDRTGALPVDESSDEDEDGNPKEGHEDRKVASTKAERPDERPPTYVMPQEEEAALKKKAELRLKDQNLKDRLAVAARGKLAQASKESKEKMLMAERKKRAAMFVSMLQKGGDKTGTEEKDGDQTEHQGPATTESAHSRLAATDEPSSSHHHRGVHYSEEREGPIPSASISRHSGASVGSTAGYGESSSRVPHHRHGPHREGSSKRSRSRSPLYPRRRQRDSSPPYHKRRRVPRSPSAAERRRSRNHSPYSSGSRTSQGRRSPGPVRSSASSKRVSDSQLSVDQLATILKPAGSSTSKLSATSSSSSLQSNVEDPGSKPGGDSSNQKLISKVRQMLKADRETVYKSNF